MAVMVALGVEPMKPIERRIEDLERQSGGEGMTVTFLGWGPDGGDVIVNAEGKITSMSRVEFDRLYPDYQADETINLAWGDDDL